MDPRIVGIILCVVLFIVNVVLVAKHQKTVFEMKRRHIMCLQRLAEASKANLPPPVHELFDAVIDEETGKV